MKRGGQLDVAIIVFALMVLAGTSVSPPPQASPAVKVQTKQIKGR